MIGWRGGRNKVRDKGDKGGEKRKEEIEGLKQRYEKRGRTKGEKNTK